MSPIKRARHDEAETSIIGGHESARSSLLKPLDYSGSLDNFKHQEMTPAIGREYEGLQVRDLLKWGDEMIRDLAITSMSMFMYHEFFLSDLYSQSRSVVLSSFAIKM